MNMLNNAIYNIFHDKHKFCRLCFGDVTENSLHLQDELLISNLEITVPLDNILTTLLSFNLTKHFSKEDRICDECVKSAVSSHAFIDTCVTNSNKLLRSLDSLYESLKKNSSENLDGYKTLFLSLNCTDMTSNQHFDQEKCTLNPASVLKRFNSIREAEELKDISETENEDLINKDICFVETDDSGQCAHNCGKCPKTCSRFYNLKLHYNNIHHKTPKRTPRLQGTSNKNGFVCCQCGKVYKDRHTLRSHERSHTLRLPCTNCNRIYKSTKTLKDHVCRTNNERPLEKNFICDSCGANFATKQTLLLHLKFEHGNGVALTCEWCTKKYYAKSQLKLHILKHTKEKNFKCDECGGRFVTKASLTYHQRIHTGEKPFKCKYCDEKFLSASRRSDHTRRHHMEPSLHCGICPKVFKGCSSLSRHRKLHKNPNSTLYDPFLTNCPNVTN